jgi:hypothetical protein
VPSSFASRSSVGSAESGVVPSLKRRAAEEPLVLAHVLRTHRLEGLGRGRPQHRVHARGRVGAHVLVADEAGRGREPQGHFVGVADDETVVVDPQLASAMSRHEP